MLRLNQCKCPGAAVARKDRPGNVIGGNQVMGTLSLYFPLNAVRTREHSGHCRVWDVVCDVCVLLALWLGCIPVPTH